MNEALGRRGGTFRNGRGQATGLDSGGTRDPDTGGDLDVGQLWRALKRRRRWIILPTLLALAGSVLGVSLVTPRYTSEARILLQSGDSYYTRPSGSSDRDGQIDERDVMSQVQIITSRDLAREAIARLGLKGNPDFDPSMRPALWRRLAEEAGLLSPPSEERANEKLLEEYRDRVLAFPVMQSRVLTVEFTALSPALAARGADTVAELFLEAQADSKIQTARSAGGWLNATIEPLRAKVQEAEAKVEAFRSQSGLLVGTNNATLAQQQLAEMNGQLTAARTAQADAQARARLIREALASGRPLEVSDVANNELVRRLVADEAALKAQIALESRTLLPGHPRIKELNAQLASVQGDLRASAEKAARTLENDALVAQARVESLSAAVEALKQQMAAGTQNEVTLRAMEREAKALRDQLDGLMTRYGEATAREAREASPADARIISRADVPSTPSFPKKLPIIAIATLAALLVSAALVVTGELVSGRAFVVMPREREADTAEAADPPVRHGGEPASLPPASGDAVLGDGDVPVQPGMTYALVPGSEAVAQAEPKSAAPHRHGGMARPVPPDPANDVEAERLTPAAMARLFDTLREAAGGGFVCLVAGADRAAARDGALRLGRALAGRCRAIVVDATASRAPAGQPGLRDLSREGVGFKDVIHRDPRSRLHLVGPGQLSGEEAINDGILPSLEALRQTYDCVLVCCDRPQRPATWAWWIARQVEPVVIVAASEAEVQGSFADFERARPERGRPLLMAYDPPTAQRASA